MTVESTLALAAAIFILGVTPGPGVFAIVVRALAYGFAPTLVFMCGVIAGDLMIGAGGVGRGQLIYG
jgi:threonine/homoserine/homoserine lactone efflux protein